MLKWLSGLLIGVSDAGNFLVESPAGEVASELTLAQVRALLGAPTALAGGTKTVAAIATPEALVAVATPCRFVWIGARVDSSGNAVNTKPAFIGDSAGQNIPVMTANFEGFVVQVDDASKLFVKVGVNGEGVAYRIFA